MNASTGADEQIRKQDLDQVSYESKDHNKKNDFMMNNDPYKDETPI